MEHSTKEELVQFTFVFKAQAGEYKGVAFDECMTEEIEKKKCKYAENYMSERSK